MSSDLVNTKNVQAFLDRISGVDQEKGDARLKKIVRRIVSDLFEVIDEHDVSAEEFWRALNFLQQSAPEFGLWAPGFGFDHYLDLRMDEADKANGRNVGTPRTIEGPLYVPGAPIETGFARLDDGSEDGEVLIMQGQVTDLDGAPIPGAVVDVWHANIQGNYSHFDPSQSDYNNRRRIKADDTGRYKFRSLVPSGYSVPPGSGIEKALDAIGRHGSRPAHIHFFVSAPGRRHLTTQINIAGDPFLYDDFAFATHEELIPEVVRVEDAGELKQEGLNTRFSRIEFNFVLPEASGAADGEVVWRARAPGVQGRLGMEAGKARLGDGCRIAYRVDGRRDAPALIFSNSLGCDMRMWDSQAAALAKNFRVLRYDARGHGASDRPAGAYSVDRLGRDVVELMDFLSIGEANFCGLSLGGMVGQWLGVRAPERLNKLVLANTAAYLGPPSSWDARIDLVRERGMAAIADAVIARWFTKTFLNESSDITDHWRGVLSSADSAGYAGCCAAIRDMDMRATAHLIKPRTLVIAGAQDEATPPDESKFIAERLYQGSLAQLNAAHLSNIECDEAFTGLIAEFFQNA